MADEKPAADEQVEEPAPAEEEQAVDEQAADGEPLDQETVEAPEEDAELVALRDQVLRAQAEVENVRRRSQRDVENAHKYALERFVEHLLPVIDSLDKGVEAAESAESDEAQAIGEGTALSVKLLMDVLGKQGVEQVDPLGEPFDPSRHEAMAMVENPDAEPNSVMDVMAKGYVLNGRVVRAAKVVVVKPPASEQG